MPRFRSNLRNSSFGHVAQFVVPSIRVHGGTDDVGSGFDTDSDDSSIDSERTDDRSIHSHDNAHPQHRHANATRRQNRRTNDVTYDYQGSQVANEATANYDGNPDEDTQHGTSSWSDHLATCEKCAKMHDSRSSRPSTLLETASTTARNSAQEAVQSNFTTTTTKTNPRFSKRAHTTFGSDDFVEVVEPETKSSAKYATNTSARASNMSGFSVPTKTVKVRKPDGTIVKVRRSRQSMPTATVMPANIAMTPPTHNSGKAYRKRKDDQTSDDLSLHQTDHAFFSDMLGKHDYEGKGADSGVIVQETEK